MLIFASFPIGDSNLNTSLLPIFFIQEWTCMLASTFIKYQVAPHTFACFSFPWRFQPPCHCSPSLNIQVVIHNLRQTLMFICHSTLIKWWHAPHSFTTNLYITLSFNSQLVTSISQFATVFHGYSSIQQHSKAWRFFTYFFIFF
jgi:hypothetical protein